MDSFNVGSKRKKERKKEGKKERRGLRWQTKVRWQKTEDSPDPRLQIIYGLYRLRLRDYGLRITDNELGGEK